MTVDSAQRQRVRATRPDTPMVGAYSTNQMDDFYAALGDGHVKPSGVMNLAQHLYVAQRCTPGARVVDACCGRGLALPLLMRCTPHIDSYLGLDISAANLTEARRRLEDLQAAHGRPFPVTLTECDVAQPWPAAANQADVVIYTSALEHLPRAAGAASIAHAAAALSATGRLYLSTPNTPEDHDQPDEPKLLQYGVHVYEWSLAELTQTIAEAGLEIVDTIGLMPLEPEAMYKAVRHQYGLAAAAWHQRLHETVPPQLLGVVEAAAFGDLAAEVMLVCRRRP